MFGLTEYLAAGAAAIAIGWGGLQTVRYERANTALETSLKNEAVALGYLQQCSSRLTNLQEAARSNASIPDDLSDFDIPDSWMLTED